MFISAAISPQGTAAKAFVKAISPPYEPIVCGYIVDELHRKFQEKFPKKLVELEAFLFYALQVIHEVPMPEEEYADEKKIRDIKDRGRHSRRMRIICSRAIWIFWNQIFAIPGSYPSQIS